MRTSPLYFEQIPISMSSINRRGHIKLRFVFCKGKSLDEELCAHENGAFDILTGILPGQPNTLHSVDSDETEPHRAPPYAGAGLSHSLVLSLVPPPHDSVQLENVDHSPHTPSTVYQNTIDYYT